MPKQVWKIERFDGGLNSNSDARDIDDKELHRAEGVMVDSIGRIRTMGSVDTHDAPTLASVLTAGYGLFEFSHDRVGAHIKVGDARATATATDSSVTDHLTNSGATLPVDAVIGWPLENVTDGSTTTVTDNTGTQIVGNLSGGSDNSWDSGDVYILGPPPETSDDYLLHYDATNSQIDIYSRTTDVWGTNIIDLGSTTGGKPCYYKADGAVRISDGNFGAANRNKWFGFINQTHFEGITPGGAADSYGHWYAKNTTLSAPTAGIYDRNVKFTASASTSTTQLAYDTSSDEFEYWDNVAGDKYILVEEGGSGDARIITAVDNSHEYLQTDTNTDAWDNKNLIVFPPIGEGFNIYYTSSSTVGNWPQSYYQMGTTFIYQGGQESQIFNIAAGSTSAHGSGGNRPSGRFGELIIGGESLSVSIYATSPFDPHIIGGRVYIRSYGGGNPMPDWTLLADISLQKGVRPDLTSSYTAWSLLATADVSGDATDDAYCYVDMETITTPSPWTYKAINGYDPHESMSIGALGEGYKTAVVANRQVYIGNVRRTNEDGVTETQGDAMYKSMPGKFDVFPISRKIEASIRDGDEIVKLEEYADRILQFKKHKMHLINISQDVEFLEDTFEHKGIQHPACACKTDYGIAWVNKSGVFLYNGKSVINLLEKNGRPIISTIGTSDHSWTGFTSTYTQSIGYLPNKRQIIVLDNISANGTIFLYDLPTQSWVRSPDEHLIAATKSNFVTDWNGDLVWTITNSSNVITRKWSDASAATSVDYHTKDIDFGQPAVRKKIYRVRMSYKGGGANLYVRYQTDGDSTDKTFNNDDNQPLINAATNDWQHAELKPTTSSEANNIYSFQLTIEGTPTDANFQINDISIIYRTKNVK